MTVVAALRESRIGRLDAELLLAHALKKNRTWLYAHPQYCLTKRQAMTWQSYRTRRAAAEPVAYILGRREFSGREFTMNRHVLVPRPATEGLIDSALDLIRNEKEGTTAIDSGIVAWSVLFPREQDSSCALIDIGTGSGCIAVTLAFELPNHRIIAVDTSKQAIAVARANAKRHGVAKRIRFVHADGPAFIRGFHKPFFVVSNPPYVPRASKLPKDVAAFEPKQALFGGKDGLKILRPLLRAAHDNPSCRGFAVECRRDQMQLLERSILR